MENTNIENMTSKKTGRNIEGFVAGVLAVAIAANGVGLINTIKENSKIKTELKTFVSILDKDKNGKLSANEIKTFYDATKLSPYTTPFDSITRTQWNSFLKQYR